MALTPSPAENVIQLRPTPTRVYRRLFFVCNRATIFLCGWFWSSSSELLCPWVFLDRRLLLGVVEDIETDAQCDFVKTLSTTLGDSWDPAIHARESRRDSMLIVFGKVQPFTMVPALQINKADARLLVEALSGRWSYEQERRDRRSV
jgi:hypothetical protein